MSWFPIGGDTIVLSVHAQPGAKLTEVQGLQGDAVKIRVTALPVDAAANKELIQFLANVFKVRQLDVALTQG